MFATFLSNDHQYSIALNDEEKRWILGILFITVVIFALAPLRYTVASSCVYTYSDYVTYRQLTAAIYGTDPSTSTGKSKLYAYLKPGGACFPYWSFAYEFWTSYDSYATNGFWPDGVNDYRNWGSGDTGSIVGTQIYWDGCEQITNEEDAYLSGSCLG